MYYITIDCGTTNSRVYVVDETGKVYGKAAKKVGVRNTSMSGSRRVLEDGLRETVAEAVQNAGITLADVRAAFSSGMITSEIGLKELPHLEAPCDVRRLAENIAEVTDVKLAEGVPVYFVRGIKNKMPADVSDPTRVVGELDFMRGEETQAAGLLQRGDVSVPATLVVLSSHTKFIPINEKGEILGSLTTLSGQVYEAILAETFVGKSVEKRDNADEKPEGYFDEAIVKNAIEWIGRVGIVRSLMFPRFLDVLLDTKWYERQLFFEALIAAEDMLAIRQLDQFSEEAKKRFVLVGLPGRCRLYRYILSHTMQDAQVTEICSTDEIDELSIRGILHIAKEAGILS